jgi:hypothetical protein
MGRTTSFFNLQDALAQPDCAVCRLKAEAADQYLDSLIWESVNDPGIRRRIRKARGFCYEHAWRLEPHRESVGVTIIMHDVLNSMLKVTEDAQFQKLPVLSLRRTKKALDPKRPAAETAKVVAELSPQTPCPVCVEAEEMEGIYLDTLIENLVDEEDLLAAFQSSDGLCLPHFRRSLTRLHDEAVFEALMAAQRAIWERLVGHLSEIIRKADYRFKDEARGEEVGASVRAIAAIAGARRDQDT